MRSLVEACIVLLDYSLPCCGEFTTLWRLKKLKLWDDICSEDMLFPCCQGLYRQLLLYSDALDHNEVLYTVQITLEESIEIVLAMTAPQPSSKAFFMTA